jgi:hypothetical protein
MCGSQAIVAEELFSHKNIDVETDSDRIYGFSSGDFGSNCHT